MSPEATYDTLGVTYQIFIPSFADSNSDGIGDLEGIIDKLPYLKELGIGAIWLSPIHPSPSYHKYDVTDYYNVDSDFGDIKNFKRLIHQAHNLGLRVIMDLVINHCSVAHPWFQKAKKGESEYRNYFIWKNRHEINSNQLTKKATGDSNNRFVWNKVDNQDELYYSFFWSGMPDLNYDNEQVRNEVFKIAAHWINEMGVDGFRLDAAKHIYPADRMNDTIDFWKIFKQRMMSIKSDIILIGEVWSDIKTQTDFASVFTGLFNFDLSYSILESVKRGTIVKANTFKDAWKVEERGSPVEIFLESANAFYDKNKSFHQCTFLSNHDQTRVMSFLGNKKQKAKLAASILLTFPGFPFVYYGEELGMRGRKPDQYIREPMLWSDSSQTSWITSKHNKKELIQSTKDQSRNKNSLYNHYKTLIHLRNESAVLRRGSITLVRTFDEELFVYKRVFDNKVWMMIHNLSKSSKAISHIPYASQKIFSSHHTDHESDHLEGYESQIYDCSHSTA